MSEQTPPWAGSQSGARGPRRLVESTSDSGAPVAAAPPAAPAGPPRGAPPPGAAPPPLRQPAATGSPAATPVVPGAAGTPAAFRALGVQPTAGSQPPGFGVVIGVVDGSVSVVSELRRFWGVKALLALVVASLLVALAGGLGQVGFAVLSALVAPVVLLAFFGLLVSVLLGVGPVRYFSTCHRGVTRLLRGLARGVIRGLRAGTRQGMSALRPAPESGHTVTVRRFRVQSVTGEVSPCVLVGELAGDEIRHGDVVRVQGWRTRHGHYQVRRIDVLSSPAGPVVATVTARTSVGYAVGLWSDRVAKCLGILVIVFFVLTAW